MNTGKVVAATFATGVALMLAGCATSLDPTAQHYGDSQTINAKIDAVQLDTEGSVTIAASDSATTSIQRTVYYHGDKPGRTVSTDGATLVLGTCGSDCSVTYTIAVPKGSTVTGRNSAGALSLNGLASVDVHSNSGDVRVANVPGQVKVNTSSGTVDLSAVGSAQVQTSSGSIALSGVTGQVDARATSGSVTATGLHDAARLHTSSGSISASTAVQVDLDAQTSNGSVALTVPAGDYRLQVTARRGQSQIAGGVRGDTSAQHALVARTDNGRITVNQSGV